MRFAIVVGAALALAACNGSNKEDPNAHAAGGEVLPGTISDAMIDLEKSTAQAPLAPHKAAKGEGKDSGEGSGKDSENDAKKGSDASAAANEAAAPAAKPGAGAAPSPAAD